MQISLNPCRLSAYKDSVAHELHIGDFIHKKRRSLGWNQRRLGEEAQQFTVSHEPKAIDPNTVGDVETYPYARSFETVLRVLAAMGCTLSDAERAVGNPFLEVPSARPKDANARERDRLWKLCEANGTLAPVLETMRHYAGLPLRAAADPEAAIPTTPVTQATASRTHRRKKRL